ncbi:Olfactory Receptor 11G2 [Manis pentadactyla]|nr:Olfactory Receptor 11G2 [Manis pentadactyla]KAI5280493.1 Olfactory Receptor 11G2 [Manis pentadactyla]
MNVSGRETTHAVSHFILMGFPSRPEAQLLYFGHFSAAYTLTLMGERGRCLRCAFSFFSSGCEEGFFLCIMAFDRHLAVCRPPRYPRIMTRQLCTGLVVLGWSFVLISQLPYRGPNTISHFVCDPVPLMVLSCSDDTTTQFIYSTFNSVFMIGPLLFILCSYALVTLAVLRMPSAAGKRKAFSTCASHLAVVILFLWLCYGDVR